MKKVKVGIVGNGWWVDSMYLPALATSGHGEVVAIAGRIPTKTEEIAKRWGLTRWFSGDQAYKDMLAEVDAVIIASSTHTHFEIAEQCLMAGKHVLVEKPMGTSAEQCRRLVALAKSRSLVNQVAFTYGYMPEMKYLIDMARLHSVSRFTMEWNAGFMLGVNHPADKHNALLGNSILSDVGSHFIYLAQRMFGDVKEVFALAVPSRMQGAPGFAASELGGFISLTFCSGCVGLINIQTDSKLADKKFNMIQTVSLTTPDIDVKVVNDWVNLPKITVTGLDGVARDESGVTSRYTDAPLTSDAIANYKKIFRTTDVMARSFCRAIAEGQISNEFDFEAGLKVQEVVDAIHESIKAKKSVGIRS